jgi:hypothetical protein
MSKAFPTPNLRLSLISAIWQCKVLATMVRAPLAKRF